MRARPRLLSDTPVYLLKPLCKCISQLLSSKIKRASSFSKRQELGIRCWPLCCAECYVLVITQLDFYRLRLLLGTRLCVHHQVTSNSANSIARPQTLFTENDQELLQALDS